MVVAVLLGVVVTMGELVIVTVLVLVLVLGEAGAAVVVVTVVAVVVAVVDEVVVAVAGAITPQATRLPESPVASVCSSGPAAPFFWV